MVGGHERINPGDEEDAGGDHRGRVDEGGDGGRALHGVGQPDMERELAGLADGPAKDQEADGRRGGEAARKEVREVGERGGFQDAMAAIVEEQRALGVLQPEQAEEEAEIADARRDEGLLRGGCGGGLVEPETDEEIRGQADQLPAHEEQEEAVGDQQSEHRGGEEAEEAEKLLVVGIVLHVARAENEDQQADEGDHHAHEGRQWVEQQAEAERSCAEIEPREV